MSLFSALDVRLAIRGEAEYLWVTQMSESEEYPSDIEAAAEAAVSLLVPAKSKLKYEASYKQFQTWLQSKKLTKICEKVVLAYFVHQDKVWSPPTMWSQYSMLRSTIFVNNNVDLSKFATLIGFLKRKNVGYRPKKSKIFTKENIEQFLVEADDDIYLMMKVVLIVGIGGACRRQELLNLSTNNIEDLGKVIIITLPDTKTNVPRQFVINDGNFTGINLLALFRKYALLRPKDMNQNRFFVKYQHGKCMKQFVGLNTFGQIPKKIAIYLGLDNTARFTGHCFRRSSASLLADSGVNMSTLKRFGGWKSTSTAEGYLEDSLQNKIKNANNVLGNSSSNSGATTSTVVRESASTNQIEDTNNTSSVLVVADSVGREFTPSQQIVMSTAHQLIEKTSSSTNGLNNCTLSNCTFNFNFK